MNEFCPRSCFYLNPTEKGQTDKKEGHYCELLKVFLKHEGWHPDIPSLSIQLEAAVPRPLKIHRASSG